MKTLLALIALLVAANLYADVASKPSVAARPKVEAKAKTQPKASHGKYVCCPACGMSGKLERTGKFAVGQPVFRCQKCKMLVR